MAPVYLCEPGVKTDGRFRALFDNASDPDFVIAAGVIVDCNPATPAAFGLASKADVLQIRPSTLSPAVQPDCHVSADKSAEMDALAYSRGVHRFGWVHRRADASSFPVQVTLNSVEWNGRSALISFWHDLTETRRREQELLDANAKLAEAHAAIANVNAALGSELEAVGRIQRSLLPRPLPLIPTLSLAADYRTSSRAGGDHYHLFDLGSGRWGIFVAHVSEHGTSAVVMMAVTHALVHAYLGPSDSPGHFLCPLNNALWRGYTAIDGVSTAFVTAFFGVYDASARTLTHARAGHPLPRLLRRGHVGDLGKEGGLPLGICGEKPNSPQNCSSKHVTSLQRSPTT